MSMLGVILGIIACDILFHPFLIFWVFEFVDLTYNAGYDFFINGMRFKPFNRVHPIFRSNLRVLPDLHNINICSYKFNVLFRLIN